MRPHVALWFCAVAAPLISSRAGSKPDDAEGPLWTEGHHADHRRSISVAPLTRLVRGVGAAVVSIQTLQLDAEQVLASGRPSRPRGQGTGFIIHKKGLVLTNQHVIDGADEIRVRLADERLLPARVVGSDQRSDVALLQIDAGGELPVAPLGDSDRLEIGESVIAIGNPFGLDHTVTAGIISGKGRRDVRPGGSAIGFFDFIQTDASINVGNSGGPLINSDGEVIGINTAMNAQAQGIAFAIPINMVKSIVPLLRRHGRAPRGWVGLVSQAPTAALRSAFGLRDRTGALVSDVTLGSPAAEAGITPGDVILAFGSHPIRRAGDLDWLVATSTAGRAVDVSLLHDGRVQRRALTPRSDPEDAPLSSQLPPPREERHRSPFGMVVSELRLPGQARPGVVVVQVEPGSPASEASIERGDVLLRVGERAVAELDDYARAVRSLPRGAIIKLLLQREGRNLWAAFEKR